MSIPVFVVTEGMTEMRVGLALYERRVLDPSIKPIPGFNRETLPREGYHNVLDALLSRRSRGGLLQKLSSSRSKVLLLFDQETLRSPMARAADIAAHFQEYGGRNDETFWESFRFEPFSRHDNLFCHVSDRLELILHVADAAGPFNGNRDFDGYILRLLQGSEKAAIAQRLAKDGSLADRLIRKAETEMPAMMETNGVPIDSSKSWLYIYIATFQQKTSHVGFAENVVRNASEDALREVFDPLITAWNTLTERSPL